MNTRLLGRVGQVAGVLGVAMAIFSSEGYGGAMSCRGWDRIACTFHAIFWLFGSQLVAAPLQWLGVKNTQGTPRTLAILGAAVSTLLLAGIGSLWLYIYLSSYHS